MCATDRAGCGQDFACIVPVFLVGPSLLDGPDPLGPAGRGTELPNRRPPGGQANVFLASALAQWPLSYPEAGFSGLPPTGILALPPKRAVLATDARYNRHANKGSGSKK